MRYLTYRHNGTPRLGALHQGYIVDIEMFTGGPNTMLDFIMAGPEVWRETAQRFTGLDAGPVAAEGRATLFDENLLMAPIPRPLKNVFCLGRNYYKHFLESAQGRGESDEKPPAAPIYFTKPPTSVNGPYSPIVLDPEVSSQLDWEAELGVIIGIGGRKIAKEDAMNHVFGYTVINDVSARDLQTKHMQWFKGKGLDGSCPMGPVIVTPDELPSPVHVPIYCRVNGEVKQEANTGQMMFDIPTQIADLSLAMTLEPGDIISTGTPDGVGGFRNPPEFLQSGDVMETEIEGIGVLRNSVIS